MAERFGTTSASEVEDVMGPETGTPAFLVAHRAARVDVARVDTRR